jgi:hypothetical protein
MRHVNDPNLRGTIKELAQLDGAFVVSRDGHFIGLPLSGCHGIQGGIIAWAWQPAYSSSQHQRRYERRRNCRFRELGS